MIQLAPHEQVLLMMRRHWYIFLRPTAAFLVALVVPSLVLTFGPRLVPALVDPAARPVINFFLALYLMGLLTWMLIIWTSYYLDAWIITDRRIIDIEQHGLFHREVSEIALERVENVTIEIPGFIATLLGFGNIKIQTAGEDDFIIKSVPSFYRAKDIILKYSRVPRETRPHEPEEMVMAGYESKIRNPKSETQNKPQ